ncbi:helix-turn-helix domain-containing protein [Clostridium botulinum]|uniref:helix-turn-helix domain-containing protein n=1 Tax=Clostridium botulinum TaxID=1491 RepID=UPI0019685366|nr:XRE family transcriptional regulator [Clostridium botulinum]
MFNDNFGNRLKELREDKELKQSELANMLNIARNTISSYESNINEPSLDILVKIADIFNVSLDYLLCRTNIKYNLNLEGEQNKDFILELYKFLNSYKIERK